MTEDQRLAVICGTISSNLYLAGVFIAGLLTAHPFSWKAALATAGIVYLDMLAVTLPANRVSPVVILPLTILSVAIGAAAGLSLLL